jgi:hypothetical protein
VQGLSHAFEKRLFGDFEQSLNFGTDCTHANGPAIVSDHPIFPYTDIHGNHIPILQNSLFHPNSMNHFIIHGETSVGGKDAMPGTVSLAGTLHSQVFHKVTPCLIHFKRTHTRSDEGAEPVQNSGGGTPGSTHLFFFLKTFANHGLFICENKSAFNHKAPKSQFFRSDSSPQ